MNCNIAKNSVIMFFTKSRRIHCMKNCNARGNLNWNLVKPGSVSPKRDVPGYISAPNYVILPGHSPSLLIEKPEIKSLEQIQRMRETCSLARTILNLIGDHIKPGISTDELDKIAHDACIRYSCYPSPLLYRGYPKSICTSVNNVACHGIPDDRLLLDGDIINVDVTVFFKGCHGDVSETFCVGDVDPLGRKLVRVTKICLKSAIEQCGPGRPFSIIGNTVSKIAFRNGFTVLEEYCGHGIGEYFHGPPDIFHIANDEPGVMEEGMTFTIEPILCEGSNEVHVASDKWTVVSSSGSRSAQFEHTVLITANGTEILTL